MKSAGEMKVHHLFMKAIKEKIVFSNIKTSTKLLLGGYHAWLSASYIHRFLLFVDFCRGLNIMILPCYMHEDGDKLVLTNYLYMWNWRKTWIALHCRKKSKSTTLSLQSRTNSYHTGIGNSLWTNYVRQGYPHYLSRISPQFNDTL